MLVRAPTEPGMTSCSGSRSSDTGIGIAPDGSTGCSSVQPGRRLDHARYGGTGLGLAISRRLVEAMGGDDRVSQHRARARPSSVDDGAPEVDAAVGDAPRSARRTCRRALLMVDDNADQPPHPGTQLAAWGMTRRGHGRAEPALDVGRRGSPPTTSRCSTCTCRTWTASSSAARAPAGGETAAAAAHAPRRAPGAHVDARTRLGPDQAGQAGPRCTTRCSGARTRGEAPPRRAAADPTVERRCGSSSPRTTW